MRMFTLVALGMYCPVFLRSVWFIKLSSVQLNPIPAPPSPAYPTNIYWVESPRDKEASSVAGEVKCKQLKQSVINAAVNRMGGAVEGICLVCGGVCMHWEGHHGGGDI